MLLVSPERLNNPSFRDQVLPGLSRSAGLVVIDEAHCISDWGHDFRPDYRRLRTLLEDLPAGIPVLATTATANARVTADVAEQLGPSGETLVLRGPLDRDSLRLAVVTLPTAHQRLGWLAARLNELPGSGIIYALTVAAAQETAAFLREQGLPVASYTGRDEPEERARAEEDLLANRVKALVATSALGMGFDKPDLGFVVHLGAPQSPVAYYQQIGRAGRALDRAEVILLPGREDRDIWAYFASLAFPPERQVRATLATLAEAGRPLSAAVLETHVDLSRGRLESMLKVLDVDGAVRRVGGGWTATGQPWHYDAERYERVAAERAREQEAMLGLSGHGRVPDGVPAPAARRSGRRAVRPLRQLHRAARRKRGSRGERVRGARAAAPPGRDGRAAADVADRDEGPRRGRGREDPGRTCSPSRAGPWAGSPTSAGAPSSGLAGRGRAGRAGHRAGGGRGDQGAGRLGLGPAPGRRAHPAVTHPPPADHQPRPPARQRGAAVLPRRARLHPRGRPRAAPPQQRAAAELAVAHPGGTGRRAGSRRRRWTARCSWWTTGSRPDGP